MKDLKDIKNIKDVKDLKKPSIWWGEKTTAQKWRFAFYCLFIVIGIILLFVFVYAKQIFGPDSELGLIIGDYENGFVAFGAWFADKTGSIIASAFAIFAAMAVYGLLSLINKGITFKGKKAKTVGSILQSLTRYAVIIIAAFIVLGIWGVNVATLLGGIGILSLIIGLGCQSLINDIISGIFLVTDKTFDVGDIVVIDDFRGTVVEIGIKSTKVMDAGGNIKTISNSSITSIVNMTDKNSVAVADCDISYEESLEKVEQLINKSLPQIRKSIPKINGAIEYKGVAALAQSGVTLRFIAPCKEENRFQVVRDMNRAIILLFTKNGIKVPYPQLDVHLKNETGNNNNPVVDIKKDI